MRWKLVRDRNQEYCQPRGVTGKWRTSPDPVGALTAKLGEEYGEFTADRDPAELFDVLDVVRELIFILDPLHEARERHQAKVALMGKFSKHLEWHAGLDEVTERQA